MHLVFSDKFLAIGALSVPHLCMPLTILIVTSSEKHTNSDLKREKSKCNSTPHVKFIGDEVCMAGLLLTTSCRPRAWPPNGLALGLGLGLDLGSAWSGPTCKVEIDHTHVILCRLAHVSREPPYVITYHGISLMNFMCKSKNLVRTCEHTAVPLTR